MTAPALHAADAVAPGTGPAAAPEPLLRAEGVYLGFGGIQALAGVSLDVMPGEITAVIGPNGAGKTSLFNTLSGFYRPQRGRVLLEGRDLTGISADRRAALGLARTFQNVALFRGMSVLDNIKLGGHTRLNTNPLTALWYRGPACCRARCSRRGRAPAPRRSTCRCPSPPR